MPLRQSAASLEYVRVLVSATESGAVVDPSADIVAFAFVAPGATPGDADWKDGDWEATTGGRYYARALVGPGGTAALTGGTYHVWLKITDSPEVPVRMIGLLVVS